MQCPRSTPPERCSPSRCRSKPGVTYDASAIQVLEGLEAVRKRPGMYIGSTGERGLHHLVWEVVDNSVDEALAGYCDRVVLTLQADGGVRVEDNGRGIPTDIHPTEGIPAVTMALTLLHAGGKFGGSGYKVSGGLHGVGISVVNALSSRVVVEVKNRGHLWRQTFSVGVPDGELEQVREMEPGESTGTTITFYASEDIFETTRYNLETMTNRIREYAFLNKGLEIVVRDERPAEEVDRGGRRRHHAGGRRPTPSRRPRRSSAARAARLERRFKYDRGLVDYVEHLNRRKDKANPTIINFEAETPESAENHMSLELAMQWNTSFNESVHTFANTINTHEGGTHEEGFRASLTSPGQQLGRGVGPDQEARGPGLRRRHPRGPDRDHLDQAGRAAVRGPDQDQARQHRGQGLRAAHGQRPARRLAGEEPRRGQGHRPQGAGGGFGADRGPQGARPGPVPQGTARWRRPARQAQRLPVDEPRGVRGLHRRGRLGRRLRPPGPRPADPGDPPDPRQDPQRREGPHRQGAGQPGGPGDHLRARHRRARGVRRSRSCATTRSC